MWAKDFSGRLESWNLLRDQCRHLSPHNALTLINHWWFQSPWQPYYLHWDDQNTWPDPWQLLSDDVYCYVARGLGMLYTISLLDRADLGPASLILTTDGHNLVQACKTKYILNWTQDSVVNTFQEVKIQRQYEQHQIA
jgi:hypothetical protein